MGSHHLGTSVDFEYTNASKGHLDYHPTALASPPLLPLTSSFLSVIFHHLQTLADDI